MRFTLLSCVAAALSFVTVSALPTISTQGSYFFTSDGDRWFVKGVAYQLSESDPLLDAAQCSLDAALMKTLGANAIRVYHVSPGQDHSACMNTFADNGIYLFVDLDTFNTEIVETAPEWNSTQLAAFEAIMDEFHSFTNTAGFFIGNEVLTDPTQSEAAAYIKASVRDLKAYRTQKGYREIPIGYSHADISSLRPNLQNYLACGSNTSESIDFFGLNSYEWCGSASSYVGSGYAALTALVKTYPIPIFFSETGCIIPEPRLFEDQTAIFGSDMTPYWSGAIVYEWIQEVNHYGIITYGDDTNALITSPIESATAVTRSGTPTPVSPDFSNLMAQWATATPSSLAQSDYTASNTPPACPKYTASMWEIAGDIALPSVNEAYNSAVQYSITAGHLENAAATSTGSASGTAASGSSSASSTSTGSAARATSGGKELLGVGVGLGSVMFGFVWWL